MSLSDLIADNKAAIERLFRLTAKVCKSKRKNAVLADIALKIGGLNLTQLTASIRSVVDGHVKKTGPVHGETAEQIGIVRMEAFKAQLNKLYPEGVMPVSRYGNSGYLPPGVTGSYESGTTATNYRTAAAIMEDDGTFVYLRNATNGSEKGVYYAYMKEAVKYPNRDSTKTNRKYRPAWLPAGSSVSVVFAASETAFMGQLQDSAGVSGDYFLVLTNGTMDDTKHTGCIIPASAFASLGNYPAEVFVAGDTVYILGVNFNANGSAAVEVVVNTLSKAAVIAGGSLTPVKMTGITTNSFMGAQYTDRDTIHFCDRGTDTDASKKPLAVISGTFTSQNLWFFEPPTVSSAVNADGLIRSKMSGTSIYNTAVYSQTVGIGFSWTFNPVTKVAQIDPGFDTEVSTITGTDAGIFAGPAFRFNQWDTLSVPGYQRGTNFVDESGNVFRIVIQNVVDSVVIASGAVQGWTNKFDALKCLSAKISFTGNVIIRPQFGSAIGSNIMNPMLIGPDKLIVWTDGQAKAGWKRGFAQTRLTGSNDYQYKSIYLGSLKGYKPSTKRSFLTDDGIDQNMFRGTVQEVVGSDSFLSGQRFVSKSLKLSGVSSFNYDLAPEGTVSITEAILSKIGQDVSALVASAVGKTIKDVAVDYIVPTHTCKPFAWCALLTTDGYFYYTLAAVPPTRDAAGNIVSVPTVSSLGPIYQTLSGIGTAIRVIMDNLVYGGNAVIYETPDTWLVGFDSAFNAMGPGTSAIQSPMFRVDKATGEFAIASNYKSRAFNHYGVSRNFFASPDLGFGVIYSSYGPAGYSDETTKLVFQPLGKTKAEFDAVNGNTVPAQSTWTVLVAQNVPEGFVLYFSEITRVIMNGKYFEMGVQSVDLTTIDSTPADKTFYIYLRLNGNDISYAVELTESEESNINMYIGQITTGSEGITTIAVSKVTRLGLARLSTVSAGSAIPVATGPVSKPHVLEWS